jgi:autotransporter-associated beta strand protein
MAIEPARAWPDRTWIATSDRNFDTTTNWNPNGSPSGAVVEFDSHSGLADPILYADRDLSALWVMQGGWTISGNYTLGVFTGDAGCIKAYGGNNAITTKGLYFTRPSGGHSISFNGGANALTISSALTHASGASVSVSGTAQTDVLTLSGTTTVFTSTMSVGSGTLLLTGSLCGSLWFGGDGNGQIRFGANNCLTSTSDVTVYHHGTYWDLGNYSTDVRNISFLASVSSLANYSSSILTMYGDLSLTLNNAAFPVKLALAGGNHNLSAATGLTLTLSGAISDKPGEVGAVTKTGAGVVTLTNTNTFSGDLTVSEGTLSLTGAGSVSNCPQITVNGTFNVSGATGGFTLVSGRKLSGAGTVSGGVALAGGSILSPGDTVGTLTMGNITVADGAEYDWDLSASSQDRINCGTLDFGNNGMKLRVHNVAAKPDRGAKYVLFDASAVAGFDGSKWTVDFSDTPGWCGKVRLDGNDVVLANLGVPAGTIVILR